MQRGEKLPPLDTSRYTIQAPKTSAKPTAADVEAWQGALRNAESQIEHQSVKFVSFLSSSFFIIRSLTREL